MPETWQELEEKKFSPNFSKSEFRCRCGCGIINVDPRLIDGLQQLRDLAGVPVLINGACRCPKHNKEVGGVIGSQHLTTSSIQCRAADIVIRGKTVDEMAALAEQVAAFRDGGIGRYYSKGFLHVDVRCVRARWSEN